MHPVSHEQVSMALLLVASSPSDLAELEDTARALARRGHRVAVAYFFSGSSRQVHQTSLDRLQAMVGSEKNVQAVAINVDRRLGFILSELRAWHTAASGAATGRRSKGLRYRIEQVKEWMRGNGSLRYYDAMVPVVLFPYRQTRRGILTLRDIVRKLLLRYLPTVFGYLVATQLWRIYRSYASMFNALLSLRVWDGIIVPEDVVGPFWPVLIKQGLERGVGTIVLPYTLANAEEAFKSLRGQPSVQTLKNRFAAARYPKWRMQRDGYDIVRMPAGHIFAHEWLKISPPDPWMMNSGQSRMICVDSQASLDYFLRGGIPADRLQVTGSVSQDQLARTLNDKANGLRSLRHQLGLSGEKPLLLISGCPNQLAGQVPHCEFNDMRAVAAHLGQALRPLAEHYHLVVRPHPNYVEFGELMKAHGVVSSSSPTAQLVPLCDLFIAFASATIRWAAACGIPTVNYDIFHYGYSDFAENKGVVTVSESEEFSSLLGQMRPGSVSYEAARARSAVDAAYWSVMDGRGLERIEEAIREFARVPGH